MWLKRLFQCDYLLLGFQGGFCGFSVWLDFLVWFSVSYSHSDVDSHSAPDAWTECVAECTEHAECFQAHSGHSLVRVKSSCLFVCLLFCCCCCFQKSMCVLNQIFKRQFNFEILQKSSSYTILKL